MLTIIGGVSASGTALSRRGANADTTSKSPRTLVSNSFLTWSESASIAGTSYTIISKISLQETFLVCGTFEDPKEKERRDDNDSHVPALLKRIFNFPPVRFVISCCSKAMLSLLVTSRASVSMPFVSRSVSDLVDRAVANTRQPREANWSARAWPAPPAEQLRGKFVSGRGLLRFYLGQEFTR